MVWLKSLSFMPDVANSRSLTRNKHELFDHVLAAILKSGKEGVFQTEICREFSLDSRDGSRLAGNLEKQSLISREKVLHKGRWTYKLIVKKSPMVDGHKKRVVQITSVEGAPCFSSSEDEMTQYSPSRCSWIEEWVIASFDKTVANEGGKRLNGDLEISPSG